MGPPIKVYGVTDELPPCPECTSAFTYELGSLLVCPECAHEWALGDPESESMENARQVRDSVGNVLAEGDTVTIVKDVKVKGASGSIKVGTRAKGLRFVAGVGDHDIEAKVDGFGVLQLKSSVVKKA